MRNVVEHYEINAQSSFRNAVEHYDINAQSSFRNAVEHYDINAQSSFRNIIVQELCESRGGCPGLSVLTSVLASVDVKIY